MTFCPLVVNQASSMEVYGLQSGLHISVASVKALLPGKNRKCGFVCALCFRCFLLVWGLRERLTDPCGYANAPSHARTCSYLVKDEQPESDSDNISRPPKCGVWFNR